MNSSKHYKGLSEAEVLESRRLHGANVITPATKESLWAVLLRTCRHWIVVCMAVLFVLCCFLAFALSAQCADARIWSLPVISFVATLFLIAIGFFGGFNDKLFRILIMAFVMSVGIAAYEFIGRGAPYSTFFEPGGIIAALLLATGVAFALERKNEKTFQSLNEVNDDTPVKVVREDNVRMVPRRDVVVGDIVLLDMGEEVPADCEVLECLNLTVNESSLTGEPQASKTTDPSQFDSDATYPSNHILKGTTIVEGYCTARVMRVGDATECGKVFEAAQVNAGEATPLDEKLNSLADKITMASYLVAAFIFVGRLVSYFIVGDAHFDSSDQWLDFFSYVLATVMIAVTLIVVAVPEGLPMSVTLSLAFSMRKLMKENALPRTMHACETMGAASVICTDKTGTLTQNQMTVSRVAWVDGADADVVAQAIALNTTANLDLSDSSSPRAVGNPTEGALLLWLRSQQRDYLQIREEAQVLDRLPFSTENKYMATLVASAGLCRLFVKGAPEIVMSMTDVAPESKAFYESLLLELQTKAMRTLALAYVDVPHGAQVFVDGRLNVSHLNLLGVVAIADPVRLDVPDAIRECLNAGIQVKIVTGDTPGTAKEIGRQIGLWQESDGDGSVMSGTDFAALSDEEAYEVAPRVKILSRARPNDKERLVRLLRRRNMVVAATGDGTNDAPALNAANVGLSMGDGTSVAKEASDMTILDNSFSTIVNAVLWGRSLYKNIQRFILFQMTINVAACLVVMVGAFLGTESPLSVTQMLWVNLIMDTFAAIALASLPPSADVMREKPRSQSDSIISVPMAKSIFGVGGIFTLLLLALLVVLQHSEVSSVLDLFSVSWTAYNGLSDYELSLFFTVFVMLQFWNMFNARAFMTSSSALKGLANCKGFLFIAFVIGVGQVLIVQLGGPMFNVSPLSLIDWCIVVGATSVVLWIGELFRALHNVK